MINLTENNISFSKDKIRVTLRNKEWVERHPNAWSIPFENTTEIFLVYYLVVSETDENMVRGWFTKPTEFQKGNEDELLKDAINNIEQFEITGITRKINNLTGMNFDASEDPTDDYMTVVSNKTYNEGAVVLASKTVREIICGMYKTSQKKIFLIPSSTDEWLIPNHFKFTREKAYTLLDTLREVNFNEVEESMRLANNHIYALDLDTADIIEIDPDTYQDFDE